MQKPPRQRAQRPGRNDPCPCGCGRKAKNCHPLSEETLAVTGAKRRELDLPPRPPSAMFDGQRARAVGDRIHLLDANQTLQEYFLTVLYETLGREWYEEQDAKGDRAHIVVQWYREFEALKTGKIAGIDQVEVSPGQFSAVPSGNLWSLLCLAHDVHSLRHGGKMNLNDALVARLRHPKEFQGVRYEVAVAAALSRAGFDIEWFTDTTRKLPEFKATHRDSGEACVVEAKSRQRSGAFGKSGEPAPADTLGPDVNKLLRAAKEKERDGLPLVIFLDLNLPEKAWTLEQWIAALSKEIPEMRAPATAEKPDKFAALAFTNYAWHWGGQQAGPRPEWIISFSTESVMPLPEVLRAPLATAAEQYGRLPPEDDEVVG